jgi:hypothetical protein
LKYWGPDFQAYHALHFPTISALSMSLDLGPLGLSHLLHHGGAGYFPKRLMEPRLDSGRLLVIHDAAVFRYPAYVVWPQNLEPTLRRLVLEGLQDCLTTKVWAFLQHTEAPSGRC